MCGVLLFASSVDGNGWIVHTAMAHVSIENGENGQWFTAPLSRPLSLAQREVVINDHEKGLVGVDMASLTNDTQKMAFFDNPLENEQQTPCFS